MRVYLVYFRDTFQGSDDLHRIFSTRDKAQAYIDDKIEIMRKMGSVQRYLDVYSIDEMEVD